MNLNIKHLLFFILTFSATLSTAQSKFSIQTIAFYNLENLFDTINHPDKLDELSPIMEIENKSYAYKDKLSKLANVLVQIGTQKNTTPPSVIGIAEVENKRVIEDLVNTPPLKQYGYNIIHYESPDQRGIDVALIYNPLIYKPIFNESLPANINKNGFKIDTRDILYTTGYLMDEKVHLLINHWPSRRGGVRKSGVLREQAAYRLKQIVNDIYLENSMAKVIIMGDFNDNPNNKSLKKILGTQKTKKQTLSKELFNPFEKMFKQGNHTLTYKSDLFLFDQIIINYSFVNQQNNYDTFKIYKAGIHNPNYMTLQTGKYKGSPKRSFSRGTYLGGYSDHYPVYIYLIKENKNR
ncbi:endonuclease/exonuclease/phosphatase family protein [Wenyingzhuangia sp. IMCC45533]